MSNQVEDKEGKKNKKSKNTEQDENLVQEIETLKSELEESKDKYLRLFAEFDNFKKRNIKERFDILKTAAQDTLQSLLPVLDDFDRAKKSAESGQSGEVFSEGVQLVYQKLYHILEQKGLKAMESTHTDFDPEFHEAITDIPAPSEDMVGKIIDTVEKGYILNDKIIRHAKVVVGK
ncbi:MAG: nucleotide exchange factor GrpE [Saprospiraceae bacterium]|nr:nucleotide exchange factor GrpE [Saprospiraceae bacterium]